MNKKYNALVIAGPTGVGKTSLSIKLAKLLKGEIISGDSAQIYKGLDIGTAKIKNSEMDGIKHHLIDIIPPIKKYSVGDFQKDADVILSSLEKNNIIPIVVGGTGLYIDSLTEGLAALPPGNNEIRDSFKNISTLDLYGKLLELDPLAGENIHFNNRVKIERALEVCLISKDKFSTLSKKNIKNNNFSFLKIALERNREHLYQRIDNRVDLMFKGGLFQEVESLYKFYGDPFKKLNIIGYSEIISVIDNKCSLDESINNIKKNSRHYAKRQFTWFRNSKDYIWFNLDTTSEDEIIKFIFEKLSLIK